MIEEGKTTMVEQPGALTRYSMSVHDKKTLRVGWMNRIGIGGDQEAPPGVAIQPNTQNWQLPKTIIYGKIGERSEKGEMRKESPALWVISGKGCESSISADTGGKGSLKGSRDFSLPCKRKGRLLITVLGATNVVV